MGRYLHVWPIFSYVTPCSGGLVTQFCTCIFAKHLCFFRLWGFALLLSGICSIFIFMPERIGLYKLFAKLCCYRTLSSFLRGQVVNCAHHSQIMLLSKLTLGSAMSLMYPEEALPMGPHLATDGELPCLSLVLYHECVTG
jgi:hypothetical protein